MKKLFLLCFILSLLVFNISCESKEDINSDISELRQQRELLNDKNTLVKREIHNLNQEVKILKEQLKELNIYNSGRTPVYLVKFKLKQLHYTLDIGEHIKDAANSIEVEIPVNKDFYNSISVGDDLAGDFRFGSLIMRGSLGSWNMKIINKQIN